MAMIRLNTDEVFETDSQEYEILHNAASAIKGVPGGVVEIGTRRGGSAKIIMDSLVQNQDNNRNMFCIDPYGNIEYECTNLNMSVFYPNQYDLEGDPKSKEITGKYRFDYTNNMRNRIIPSLYYYAYMNGFNFTFFCLEDKEFFKRYSDGVPVYDQVKELVNEYAFVFFDGPHDRETVDLETDFFMERSNIGSVYVFDDIWMYEHDRVEDKLLNNGYEILERKQIKASYRRVK